ncbi:MAG: peptidyl-prolyl cis-trans isomerase [Planctomycetota bacterium]|nr:peptidyl-prolyl cis-trans isomerase [Planctomycetota bacterium]MDA1114331.1 peptidyl-prolyl cis-trans isomerase [Planctomycetota bacterium]
MALLALASQPSCSRPEGLFVGPYELSYQVVTEAEQALRHSFSAEGDAILRSHLLQFGLGETAILHQSHPRESDAAKAEADTWAEKIRSEGQFLPVYTAWAKQMGREAEADTITQPNPSALGAAAAAAIALLENGEWSGPIATSNGWELILLEQRFDGPRNRAQVAAYRMLFPVGTPADRTQAKKDWDTLPLRGNPELLNALPQSFRRNRLAPEPE